MRTPMVPEEIVWGGRNAVFTNPESAGWTGWPRKADLPNLPAEYGGGGLSSEEAKILLKSSRINARIALTSFGISMLGPVLLKVALTRKWSTFPK